MIVGTVTPGHERLCPILARHLDAMWPGHPPLHYALPAGRSAAYELVVQTDATGWTSVLLAGVEHVRRLGSSHVFVLLEDHVPLWPCDGELVAEVCRIATREDLPCVFFNKYDWPWHSTEHKLDTAGRVRGWPEIDVVTVGGHRLARMPLNHLFYNQCQPAFWNADYYATLLNAAARSGIEDPWAFEKFLMPNQPQHYISEYQWPSRHCGFRKKGKVYLRAIYAMKMPQGRELRDELLGERFPALPRRARLLLGEAFRLWGSMRGLPDRLERRSPPRGRRAS